jgi:hypothetical protein
VARACARGSRFRIVRCVGGVSCKTQLFWRIKHALESGSCARKASHPDTGSLCFGHDRAHRESTGTAALQKSCTLHMHCFCFKLCASVKLAFSFGIELMEARKRTINESSLGKSARMSALLLGGCLPVLATQSFSSSLVPYA